MGPLPRPKVEAILRRGVAPVEMEIGSLILPHGSVQTSRLSFVQILQLGKGNRCNIQSEVGGGGGGGRG